MPHRLPFSSLKVAPVSQMLLAPYYCEPPFIDGKFIPGPCLTRKRSQIECITCNYSFIPCCYCTSWSLVGINTITFFLSGLDGN